jgi:hypothetical protein
LTGGCGDEEDLTGKRRLPAGQRFASEPGFGLSDRASRGRDRGISSRFRTLGIGVGEKHAIHGLSCQRLDLGVKARSGHIYRMPAAVDVDLDRVLILSAIVFRHGGVKGEDVELPLLARMFRSHPVGHNEVGKAIARAPGVVTQAEDGFVEN